MRRSSLVLSILGLLSVPAAPAKAEDPVMPPSTTRKLLELVADGVQVYACEAREQRYAWVFRGPEATLFDADGRQVGTHGAGPSWKLADGSSVVAEKAAQAPSPDAHAIPWLLLRVTSHDG